MSALTSMLCLSLLILTSSFNMKSSLGSKLTNNLHQNNLQHQHKFSFSNSNIYKNSNTNLNMNMNMNMKMRQTALKSIFKLRGGATAAATGTTNSALTFISNLHEGPTALFDGLFFILTAVIGLTKILENIGKIGSNDGEQNNKQVYDKPKSVKTLQFKFLLVFWLVRLADWLQGPYFYEVYASKIFNGAPASIDIISRLFLVGFATTGILGPWVGRQVDIRGRRAGTVAFTILYSLGALSTRFNLLPLLLLGRIAGGIGTSLLFSAPEAWMVGEHQNMGHDGKWIGQTFEWAYAGDAIVAILAGQLASMAAGKAGPTGPYTLSVGVLIASAILALTQWKENKATDSNNSNSNNSDNNEDKVTIKEALNVISKDKKILLLGAMQALFEGAMYIFVINWVPALRKVIETTAFGAAGSVIPFGKVFSCFMACCLLGTTVFGFGQRLKISVEVSSVVTFLTATIAMLVASTTGMTSLSALIGAFFTFEMCVGSYFPSMGTLRSKYIPDAQRSVIMNIFGLPLNAIVVSVFLLLKRLGIEGALKIGAGALGIATLCITLLTRMM